MTDQTESDHAALLRDLDSAAASIQRLDRLDAEHIAKAIRALEAKVREKTADAESHLRHERMWRTRAQEAFAEIERLQKLIVDEHVADEARVDELTADRDRISANYDVLLTNHVRVMNERNVAWQERDRLAGEVDRLKADVLRQMAWKTEAQDELEDICNELPGVAFMDPPDGGSVSIAEQVKRMYAALQSQDAEVARLTSELEKARALLSIHSGQWLEDAARRAGEGNF